MCRLWAWLILCCVWSVGLGAEQCQQPAALKCSRDQMKLFAGTSNRALAASVATELGCTLSPWHVSSFADGETRIQMDEQVRGRDVLLLQSTGPPVNDNLMQLLLSISAFRRAGARSVSAVIPYFGYSRADKRTADNSVIAAAEVASMIQNAGASRVISVDIHSAQIEGFFDSSSPMTNVAGAAAVVEYYATRGLRNPVVVAPDAGGTERVNHFLTLLADRGLVARSAFMAKHRSKPNEVESSMLIGDVNTADVILLDDIIDTAGTICAAAAELKSAGAKRIFVFASHGIFSGPAASRLEASDIDEVLVTDSLHVNETKLVGARVKVISVAKLLAQVIEVN